MENYLHNSSSYPESGHSSPRSPPPPWDDTTQPNYKVKFMCSYGGKIHPRPHDNQLSYIGGDTKILAVDRHIKFAALLGKLVALCENEAVSFKYQLPGEDLDALISVTNDEDLEHMMHEYDRLCKISQKPARLRVFIFSNQNGRLNISASSGSDDAKSEKDRFIEALNSAPHQASSPAAAVAPQLQPPAGNEDFLFGLEKATAMASASPAHVPNVATVGRVPEMEDPIVLHRMDEKLTGSDSIQKHNHDLQRLRIEEEKGTHRRKNDDNFPGAQSSREYYKVPEKISQVSVSGGAPVYWTEKQAPGGVFPANTINNEQQLYMIPAPVGAFQTPRVRQVAGAPTQGYYAVQRMPTEAYRDQQQFYNMIPQGAMSSSAVAPPNLPPQKTAAYSEALGMFRPPTTGVVGVVTEAGYAQVAYDSGAGRQVVYSAPGSVIGATAPIQPPPVQYHQPVATPVSADMRPTGAVNAEASGKVGPKATQASV